MPHVAHAIAIRRHRDPHNSCDETCPDSNYRSRQVRIPAADGYLMICPVKTLAAAWFCLRGPSGIAIEELELTWARLRHDVHEPFAECLEE